MKNKILPRERATPQYSIRTYNGSLEKESNGTPSSNAAADEAIDAVPGELVVRRHVLG